MRVTILGCGGSNGVPLIGGSWGECDPNEPRNRRRRSSILVEQGDTRILVDTSPDLREQLIDAKVDWLSAVVYTHAHADHLHGLDDLRPLNYLMSRAIPIHATPETLTEIGQRFGYALEPMPPGGDPFVRPVLTPVAITGSSFRIGGIDVQCFPQDHGPGGETLGLRFGKIGYSTDVARLSEDAFRILEGIEVWIVDCLRHGPPHPTHAHYELTLSWIARVKPRHAILTHLSHHMDYRKLKEKCPPGVEPAYDGMTLQV